MIGAIFYYLKVIKLLFKVDDNLEALRACLIFLLFPAAIYLMAVYTESLFAFLSLGAIYYALRKRYLLAGVLTALATLTHINGGFLVILVALILLEEKERIANVVISFVVGCLGIIGYMAYLWVKYHNPFEFIAAQHDHGWLRHSLLSQLGNFSAVDYILAIAIIISIIYWWNRRRSFSIYSIFYLLIPIVGGQFGGYPRYTLMAFPVQFMLYDYLKDKRFIYQLMLILFSIGWTYFMVEFAAGYIVG
jgi:Gpi18-like mannosyltransferase